MGRGMVRGQSFPLVALRNGGQESPEGAVITQILC